MRHQMTLLWKEIKNMHRELLVILILQVGFLSFSFVFLSELGYYIPPLIRFLMQLSDMSFYLYPALLLYSLYIEDITGTVYQSLSLPSKRMLLRTKFIVILGAFVLITGVIIIYSVIHFRLGVTKAQPIVAFYGIIYLLSFPYLGLCIVCAAWGIMQIIHRNRFVLGIAVGIIGFGLYYWLYGIDRYYYWYETTKMIYHPCITICLGGLYALIGCFFYERYAEV